MTKKVVEDELGELHVKQMKNIAPSAPVQLAQPWGVGEAVGVGFMGLRASFGTLFLAHVFPVIGSLLMGVVGRFVAVWWLAGDALITPKTTRVLYGAGIGVALSPIPIALFFGGLCMMQLAAARGEKPRLRDVVRGMVFAPQMLVYILLQPLLLALTFLALGIPALGFWLTPYFMVDRNMSLFRAMGASWRATTGSKGALWLYHLALLPVSAVRMATLGLSDAIFQPVYGTGLAYAYSRVTATTEREPFPPEFGQLSLNRLLRATLVVSALAFGLAIIAVLALPPVRGSAWTPQDAAVRAVAVVLGVSTTIALLATMLPMILDRLEGVPGIAIDGIALVALGLGVSIAAFVLARGANVDPFATAGTRIGLGGVAAAAGIVRIVMVRRAARRGAMGRRFESFVAARHVRSQKSGFLTVISILSICGVALSSCALSTVISVMGGFSQDLKRKILGNNAHIVIDTTSQKPFESYGEVLENVRHIPGVAGATPVVQGEVMMSSASNLAGVIVKGVDPQSIGDVIDLPRIIEVGQFDYLANADKLQHLAPTEVICIGPGGEQYTKGTELSFFSDDLDPVVKAAIDTTPPYRPGIIIGRELGKTLHVCVGDEITLVSPLGDLGPVGVMPRTKKFRVAGIFYSGMYEYDASHVYTTIDIAQEYFSSQNKVSAIDVKVDDGEKADQLTPIVTAAVARPDLRVRDWREMNKNLFSALKLERLATFIILSIAILVASFCIICTLLLMVTEKGKEIAILKALGASDGAILRTFMTEGVIIGGIGTVFGVSTGLSLCSGLSWFGLRLNPDIYYIDKLPIQVSGWDFLAVATAAFTICTLATIYPAYAASKLRPVEGLRYE